MLPTLVEVLLLNKAVIFTGVDTIGATDELFESSAGLVSVSTGTTWLDGAGYRAETFWDEDVSELVLLKSSSNEYWPFWSSKMRKAIWWVSEKKSK